MDNVGKYRHCARKWVISRRRVLLRKFILSRRRILHWRFVLSRRYVLTRTWDKAKDKMHDRNCLVIGSCFKVKEVIFR